MEEPEGSGGGEAGFAERAALAVLRWFGEWVVAGLLLAAVAALSRCT